METKVVYEVEGDFGNVGGGRTLGVFETEAEAMEAARGCGSCDCGGDGAVNRRLAVPDGEGGLYLLAGERAWRLGEMEPSEAKALHDRPADDEVELVLTEIGDGNKPATVRAIRDLLPTDLRAAKRMADGAPCVVGRGSRQSLRALADALCLAGSAFEYRAPGGERCAAQRGS